MAKKKVSFVLGIRPDIIRAALILKYLKNSDLIDTELVWSGQHYSENLKDVFFKELSLQQPDVELGCSGSTDAEIASDVIQKLFNYYSDNRPDVCIFLGDTNTTTGSLACAQLNIPIYHIEGCMRSYDWSMPEEKYRTVTDHLSDIIYTYYPEYKEQGIAEGLNPNRLVVVGNPIVDIIKEFYFDKPDVFSEKNNKSFLTARELIKGEFYAMTCHRRENVESAESLNKIMSLVSCMKLPVYFPASYRTQKQLKALNISLPDNLTIVDPVGYNDLLRLMTNSKAVLTDSGTIVEETSILGVPSVQMRSSTERPQVYDCKSSVKYDPRDPRSNPEDVPRKLDQILNTTWDHGLGDGNTSKIIAEDIIKRAESGEFTTRKKEHYHLNTDRAYQDDGIIF